MGKIFDLDSPFMRFLSRMADLLWLNILTLILCIPVITAGAAFTALHYSCLKMIRGEESYVTKDYFKSFKRNFGQSTLIWLIALLVGGLLAGDFYIVLFSDYGSSMENMQFPIFIGLCVAALLYLFTMLFVFAVQSHFINPVKKTIKNAFLMSMMILPKTVLMLLCWAVIPLLMYFISQVFLLGVLFFFSAPIYVNAMIYNKTFKKFEPEENDTNDDFTWSVNSDLPEGEEPAEALEDTGAEITAIPENGEEGQPSEEEKAVKEDTEVPDGQE